MSTAYLNRGFIGPAWKHAADLLANEIIHGAWEDTDKQGLHLHVSQTSMNMTAVPAFTLSGSNLKLRFPGTGSYTLRTYVEKHIDTPVFDVAPDLGMSISVSLWAEMTIGTGAPAIDVHVNVDGGVLGDIGDWVTGWESDLEKRIKDGFGKHLGFFSTVRYDSSIALALPNPELVYGFAELDPKKAIDIVLVSDSFTASNMIDFRAVVDAFRTRLTTGAPTRVNEPYSSFDTVIRLWKIEVPSAIPSDLCHRVVAQYSDTPSGSYKTALANLARMEAIGFKVERIGADVIVFMSNRAVLGADVRAMAMGGVVMLPIAASSAAKDASVLVHELGHTILGGLADEYVEKPTTSYHGKEPKAPNVTAEKPNASGTAPAKWSKWTLNPTKRPSWDTSLITGVQGAGYYGLGLWRPAEDCKMRRSSADVPFCAVCREALTRGIRKILGEDAFLIEYGYSTRNEPTRVQVGNADRTNKMVYHIRVPESAPIQVQAKLLASSLPKPWTLSFAFTGTGRIMSQEHACRFTARLGDVLRVTVSSTCPFVPWDTLPSYTIELRCDLPLRDIPPAAPNVPVDLKAKPYVKTNTHTHPVTRQTGVRLYASSSDPNANDITFEFECVRKTEAFTGHGGAWSAPMPWTQASPMVTGMVDLGAGGFEEGNYKFRVRARDATSQVSAWSEMKSFSMLGDFEIEPEDINPVHFDHLDVVH